MENLTAEELAQISHRGELRQVARIIINKSTDHEYFRQIREKYDGVCVDWATMEGNIADALEEKGMSSAQALYVINAYKRKPGHHISRARNIIENFKLV